MLVKRGLIMFYKSETLMNLHHSPNQNGKINHKCFILRPLFNNCDHINMKLKAHLWLTHSLGYSSSVSVQECLLLLRKNSVLFIFYALFIFL